MKALKLLVFVVVVAGVLSGVLKYASWSVHHSTFIIIGDVVDDQGHPVGGECTLMEDQFVSITEEKHDVRTEPTPNGKFNFRTVPCNGGTLYFGGVGLQEQRVGFNKENDLPNPLHIVLHKKVSPVPPVVPTPIGEFEIDPAKLHWGNPAYLRVLLDLNTDGTASATTILPDNTTVNAAGRWVRTPVKDQITVTLTQPSDSPDPAKLSIKPLLFDLSGDNIRLIPRNGGPFLTRAK